MSGDAHGAHGAAGDHGGHDKPHKAEAHHETKHDKGGHGGGKGESADVVIKAAGAVAGIETAKSVLKSAYASFKSLYTSVEIPTKKIIKDFTLGVDSGIDMSPAFAYFSLGGIFAYLLEGYI